MCLGSKNEQSRSANWGGLYQGCIVVLKTDRMEAHIWAFACLEPKAANLSAEQYNVETPLVTTSYRVAAALQMRGLLISECNTMQMVLYS